LLTRNNKFNNNDDNNKNNNDNDNNYTLPVRGLGVTHHEHENAALDGQLLIMIKLITTSNAAKLHVDTHFSKEYPASVLEIVWQQKTIQTTIISCQPRH
jgi:hypothetical protein